MFIIYRIYPSDKGKSSLLSSVCVEWSLAAFPGDPESDVLTEDREDDS